MLHMGCDFWREEVVSFGVIAYKCEFREKFVFVGSFVRILKSEICVCWNCSTSPLYLSASFIQERYV